LKYHYYGPIEWRIVEVDRSASDALRLTLDRVVLRQLAPVQTPERVRISLHGSLFDFKPVPRGTIMLTGHLSPPAGAVEPSGFDFRRHAWFLRLGGLGYSHTPVVVLASAGRSMELALARARMLISTRVQAALPGQLGAFAAAVLSGDRSGLNSKTLQDLRQTDLAHLLAISGLHMRLLTGFTFTLLRLAVLCLPWSARHWPAKKIAACSAILAGVFYLALSGGNVATERAFSLRSDSVAATLVLLLRPSALLGPGFQMSFAATLALITVYTIWCEKCRQPWPKWTQPIWMVVMSSLVVGLATTPIAAAHFNMVSQYGLLANLISVPLMGLVIMPAGVIGLMLMPFELESGALWVMSQ
jgi:competence protein ComEC